MKLIIALALFVTPCCLLTSEEPNPPKWSSNTFVFTPGMDGAQEIVDNVYKEMGGDYNHGQFSSSRYALLFTPGVHNLNVKVGYYTSVIGLGSDPADTDIGQVSCPEGYPSNYENGALCTFWRSAENFIITPCNLPWTSKIKGMLWAVSQASPLRRIIVNGNLYLSQYVSPDKYMGYASGGFMANCNIKGQISSGSQQQWMTRNSAFNHWGDGVWNMVFVGCENAPASNCGSKNGKPYTTLETTPVIAEKPFISFENDRFYLTIPPQELNKKGVSSDWTIGNKIDFNQVYVATDKDDASLINSKLDAGLHIIFCPGNYYLSETIRITHANTCVLGIGFATLISQNGESCMTVENIDGVRIGGILFEAGTLDTSHPTQPLLQWGQAGYSGSSENMGFLHDCFARVGGPTNSVTNPVRADIMVQINSGHVVCDNLWLWRADHDIQGHVKDSRNTCNTAFQVNGGDVIAYGLAGEHTLQNITEWFGENGQTYFYQSELPYDVTQDNFGNPGYVGYKVGDSVNNHKAWAIGVYSCFLEHHVNVMSGIKAPAKDGISFVNAVTVFLKGNGGISHVIQKGDNYKGDAINSSRQTSYVCSE